MSPPSRTSRICNHLPFHGHISPSNRSLEDAASNKNPQLVPRQPSTALHEGVITFPTSEGTGKGAATAILMLAHSHTRHSSLERVLLRWGKVPTVPMGAGFFAGLEMVWGSATWLGGN